MSIEAEDGFFDDFDESDDETVVASNRIFNMEKIMNFNDLEFDIFITQLSEEDEEAFWQQEERYINFKKFHLAQSKKRELEVTTELIDIYFSILREKKIIYEETETTHELISRLNKRLENLVNSNDKHLLNQLDTIVIP